MNLTQAIVMKTDSPSFWIHEKTSDICSHSELLVSISEPIDLVLRKPQAPLDRCNVFLTPLEEHLHTCDDTPGMKREMRR